MSTGPGKGECHGDGLLQVEPSRQKYKGAAVALKTARRPVAGVE